MSTTAETTRLAEALPPFLTSGLIAYIGNKRRLLPFLAPIIARLRRESGDTAFLDPMTGSGAVARLGRYLGFRVFANDWEPFSYVVTSAWIENDAADLDRVFAPHGGLRSVVDGLNACGRAASSSRQRGYIAANFAPEVTGSPCIGSERLFYTAENARFIDTVRDRIDELFPAEQTETTAAKRGTPMAVLADPSDAGRARRILISLLLYEASNHANTSGVFKAYHHGFGGHGKDALGRILAPMELEIPKLIDGPAGEVGNQEATRFARNRCGDIAYLDPPYNSHQYGSNYFMLNTIALWDRPPVDSTRDGDGTLAAKAGIRSDWKRTRSPFCSRETAVPAMKSLVDSLDVRSLVVSYSASGFISPEQMADLLADRGDVTLHGTSYTAYRGGRQSLTRATSGRELVFVVTPRTRTGPSADSHEARAPAVPGLRRQLGEWKVHELLRGRFVPERLRAEFDCDPGLVRMSPDLVIRSVDCYRLECRNVGLGLLSDDQLNRVAAGLERARCADHFEEFGVLLDLVSEAGGVSVSRMREYQRRLLSALRKFAHRKYRDKFQESVRRLEEAIDSDPGALGCLQAGLDEVVQLARSRFGTGSALQ